MDARAFHNARTPYGAARKFFEEVVLSYDGDDCLTWPFGNVKGYGRVDLDGKSFLVSRLACEAVHGPAPTPEHEAAHSCGRGAFGCVTKRHLAWKTRSENEADKLEHGTHNRGERQGSSKLTEQDIFTIRLLAGSKPQREIANEFGIGEAQVSRIINGQTWKWLIERSQQDASFFRNALCILHNLGQHDLAAAGVIDRNWGSADASDRDQVDAFIDDPIREALRMPDANFDRLFALIETRQTKKETA